MDFLVSVLKVNEGKKLSPDLLKNLKVNATYLRRFNVWLFEGDWETELGDWCSENNIPIESLGEIIVPSLGGKSQAKIEKIVRGQIELKA